MILEKCEYVQPQFSIQGQTSELVLRNPIQMCNRYMTDILSMHLPPWLIKNISTGIMYLTNTTNTVKNLTIGFDIQTELLDFVVM